MAKLYFYYSAMNAGKSTVLLQSSHNYRERGMRTLLFTPAIDTRFGSGRIESRIGLHGTRFHLRPAPTCSTASAPSTPPSRSRACSWTRRSFSRPRRSGRPPR